ncbi:hypothetical protein DYB32_000369 [Aphanomyces invadans]|uniref:Uncharacterized protein n=1 Tax=Aphanomyces invadans TaxID=157072 RepID=A0A3R7D7I3_9STRA|nr:hypothetical protein DYB32_000369 [Aphanomyces invadans]
MRCALALGLGGVFFFAKLTLVVSSLQPSVLHIVVDAAAATLDTLFAASAFFLMVVQVGGTERAIDVLAKHQAQVIPPTPAFASPCDDDTQDYDQVRQARVTYMAHRRVMLQFALVHPVLVTAAAAHDATTSRVKTSGAAIRVVLALLDVGMTCVAIVSLVQLVKRFDAAIAAKFRHKGKAVIVLGYILLRCVQCSVYNGCVPPTYRDQCTWFWAMCLVQLVVLTAGFARVFAPSTFHAMSYGRPALSRVWDVFQHPVPECRTLHDTLATEFAGGASTKQLHHLRVEY